MRESRIVAQPDNLNPFEKYKAEFLDDKSDEEVLRIGEEELLIKYRRTRFGGPDALSMDPNGGNYEKLENYLLDLSKKILASHGHEILSPIPHPKAMKTFRQYCFYGLADCGNLYEKKQILKKVIGSKNNADPAIIDEISDLYTLDQYPFFLILYDRLIKANDFDSVYNRVTDDRYMACAHRPVVTVQLWKHQKEALHQFSGHHTGVVAMATATGKTVVGLAALEKLFLKRSDRTTPFHIVILAPSRPLLTQWRFEVIERLGLTKILASDLPELIQNDSLFIEFETFLTAAKKPELFSDIDLLIIDEIHKSTGPEYQTILQIPAKNKLGLSATIDGPKDDYCEHFGKIIYRYSLTEAIRDGIVPEFKLILYPSSLDIQDIHTFEEITHEISIRFAEINATDTGIIQQVSQNHLSEFETSYQFQHYYRKNRKKELIPQSWQNLDSLLRRRREIINWSFPVADDLIQRLKVVAKKTKCAVYCDSIHACEEIKRHLDPDIPISLLHSDLGAERFQPLLDTFIRSESGILISPRLFDEGLNITDVAEGFNIAHMRSPLQLIQRMGRILRKEEGKNPAFHHVLSIPPTFLLIEDALVYHHHLSWFFDLVLRTGIPLKVFDTVDEGIIEQIRESEAFVQSIKNIDNICLKSGEILSLSSVVETIDEDLVLGLLQLLASETGKISDERWLELIRSVSSDGIVSVPHLRWICICSGRDPMVISALLKRSRTAEEVLLKLTGLEHAVEEITHLHRDIADRVYQVQQNYSILQSGLVDLHNLASKNSHTGQTIQANFAEIVPLIEGVKKNVHDVEDELTAQYSQVSENLRLLSDDLTKTISVLNPEISTFQTTLTDSVRDQVVDLKARLIDTMGGHQVAILQHIDARNVQTETILRDLIPGLEQKLTPILQEIPSITSDRIAEHLTKESASWDSCVSRMESATSAILDTWNLRIQDLVSGQIDQAVERLQESFRVDTADTTKTLREDATRSDEHLASMIQSLKTELSSEIAQSIAREFSEQYSHLSSLQTQINHDVVTSSHQNMSVILSDQITAQTEHLIAHGNHVNGEQLDAMKNLLDSVPGDILQMSDLMKSSVQELSTKIESGLLSQRTDITGIKDEIIHQVREVSEILSREVERSNSGCVSLGVNLIKSGDFEDAKAIFESVVKGDPDNHKAWSLLGIVLDKTGGVDEALRCFRNAKLLDPDNPRYLKNYETMVKKVSRIRRKELKPDIGQVSDTQKRSFWSFLGER